MGIRRLLAAVSAGALGLVGAVAGTAVPAAAAVPSCETFPEFQAGMPAEDATEFFADCVPQYGIGKAEFTITSDSPIPAGFTELTDLEPTSSSLDVAGIAAYFEAPTAPTGAGATVADELIGSTDTSRTYGAVIATPVVGSAALVPAPADLTALCTVQLEAELFTDAIAYRLDFGATSTTYSQLIDGVDWSWTIDVPARSAWFIAGLADGEPYFCATDGRTAYSSLDGIEEGAIAWIFAFVPIAPEYPSAIDEEVTIWDLGAFARTMPAPPALPATGSADAAPAIGGALVLLVAGSLLLAGTATLRRRRAAED